MTFLIRFSGDLSTKRGRAFARFRSRLASNLRDALNRADLAFELQTARSRFFLEAPQEAAEILPTIFGIQSFSRAVTLSWEGFDDLIRDGEACFSDAVRDKTFAVRVRRGRVRGQVDFRSAQVERELGARLFPLASGVDLTNPEVTVRIELDPGAAHYFSEVIPCAAGLPLAGEGRCLTLISGGIDSAVAAWLMLKRGISVDYLFYNLGGSDHENQVLEVINILARRWSHGSRPRLWLVDLRRQVSELRERSPESLWQVELKRLMLHGAEVVAANAGAGAIVTGEAIGQVSSQTFDNLAVIEAAAHRPVLRPLLTFDKSEIVALARRIGTYESSAQVPEYCALHGRAPSTSASLRDLERVEAGLNLDTLLADAREAPVLDLRATAPLPGGGERPLGVDAIPDGARVVDLRSPAAFETWHYPDAVRMDYLEAVRASAHFDAAKTYVVCCEVEFKSADVAERLRAAKKTAFFFKGGTSRLLKWAESQDLVASSAVSPAVRDSN
ncbi:MAG: THUMP domain-containing protein [Acidobacteriota bacterium]|nr:THUMP domain-containing protein [Acidobacteriota bacterium]